MDWSATRTSALNVRITIQLSRCPPSECSRQNFRLGKADFARRVIFLPKAAVLVTLSDPGDFIDVYPLETPNDPNRPFAVLSTPPSALTPRMAAAADIIE